MTDEGIEEWTDGKVMVGEVMDDGRTDVGKTDRVGPHCSSIKGRRTLKSVW